MSVASYFFKGKGTVYARLAANAAAPLRALANSSELKIDINSKSETLQDYDSPAGGIVAMESRIEDASVSLTLHDLNHLNLALAYWGASSNVAGATVTAEEVAAVKGGLVRLAHAGPSSVVVKSSDGQTTHAAGTDYTVTGAGLLIPDDSTIADGATIKVDYTHGAQAVVEAMTTGGAELLMVFDGINNAMDGKPRVVDIWRVKFDAAKGIDYKGDKFASIQLTGKLLRDDGQTGVGVSKYFRETMVL
ncbi:MAG: hypothetical protein HQL51_03930 [Magnetococcales bacterium]|nr:hypothetical protein [Magnetococcales bacterium]